MEGLDVTAITMHPPAMQLTLDGGVAGDSAMAAGGRRRPGRAASHSGCQVCGKSLEGTRLFHQRYKICEEHMMADAVMRKGQLQRFCQQCGRFHPLDSFAARMRSCRAQLAKHAERRRVCRAVAAAKKNGGRKAAGLEGNSNSSAAFQLTTTSTPPPTLRGFDSLQPQQPCGSGATTETASVREQHSSASGASSRDQLLSSAGMEALAAAAAAEQEQQQEQQQLVVLGQGHGQNRQQTVPVSVPQPSAGSGDSAPSGVTWPLFPNRARQAGSGQPASLPLPPAAASPDAWAASSVLAAHASPVPAPPLSPAALPALLCQAQQAPTCATTAAAAVAPAATHALLAQLLGAGGAPMPMPGQALAQPEQQGLVAQAQLLLQQPQLLTALLSQAPPPPQPPLAPQLGPAAALQFALLLQMQEQERISGLLLHQLLFGQVPVSAAPQVPQELRAACLFQAACEKVLQAVGQMR